MESFSLAKNTIFRTIVDIPESPFRIGPQEAVLFVGSCFADSIGQRFSQDHFPVVVNPYGVMYNPASILHTIEKLTADPQYSARGFTTAVLTLGTSRVYVEKATGEMVDNCRKRPSQLFLERSLDIGECADFLNRAIDLLRRHFSGIRVVLTVSPIRYRKYGYHESQLSKSTLLLATEKVAGNAVETVYFPAYEILLDELRDYRFYDSDMIHPSEQAADYIYRRFQEVFFSKKAMSYVEEWRPIREALNHRPFQPESADYKAFSEKTAERLRSFEEKWQISCD